MYYTLTLSYKRELERKTLLCYNRAFYEKLISKLQNKNLSELFEIGFDLKDNDKVKFITQVRQFSNEKADELQRLFTVNPTQMGFDLTTSELHKIPNTLNEFEIPKTIGKYSIQRILGIGGMGVVYLGKRDDINQMVAVKVANTLLPQGSKSDAITHEAKILATLQHPNIASLVDWGDYGSNRHFVATEYVNGSTLRNFCDEHQLDVIDRIELFLKVVDAVEYAHGNLIIHRDIKPNNILVEKSGVVKLIDFGVARLMETKSDVHQQTIGAALTPSYASPEQLKGLPLSVRSDIYSLAAVLFNLLTDTLVSNTDINSQENTLNIESILKNKFNSSDQFKLLGKIDPQTFADLVLVISKAMSTDFMLRYPNTQSFKEDLKAIINVQPINARRPSKLYWLKRFVARNRLTSSMLVLTLFSTLTAVSLAAWHWHKTIQQKNQIMVSNKQLETYAGFLNTTLNGMDAYSGGNPNIKMEEFMSRAVELYQNEQEVSAERLAFHAVTLSSIYESWGHYNDALKVLKTGLEHAQRSPSPHDNISLLTEKSLLHGNDLQYQLGAQAALEALVLIKKFPETEWRSPYALLALSSSYRDSGKLKKSLQVTQRIISDPRRSKKVVAFATYAQAKVQAKIFHLDQAIVNIKIALKTYKKEYGNKSAQVADSEALLFLLNVRKNLKAFTLTQHHKLLNKYKNVYNQDHPNVALLLDTIAQAYYLTGDINQAITLQQQSVFLYNSLTDPVITDITFAHLHLARYFMLIGQTANAMNSLNEIDQNSLKLLPDHALAEYYLMKSWNLLAMDNLSLTKESLLFAKSYLQQSEYLGLVAEYNFRMAQLAALESNWQVCFKFAQQATKLATDFYPKSWSLPDVYRYLQETCSRKSSIPNESVDILPYLDRLLQSPWKEETTITQLFN